MSSPKQRSDVTNLRRSMIRWDLNPIWCPGCQGEDIFYRSHIMEWGTAGNPYCVWYYLECNECGYIWEAEIKLEEYKHD
jgi:uncharacterized Zn finger protein